MGGLVGVRTVDSPLTGWEDAVSGPERLEGRTACSILFIVTVRDA